MSREKLKKVLTKKEYPDGTSIELGFANWGEPKGKMELAIKYNYFKDGKLSPACPIIPARLLGDMVTLLSENIILTEKLPSVG